MTRLAISNIAWGNNDDETVYRWMQEYGFTGLEIAPTRIFPTKPYENLTNATKWSKELNEKYGFIIPSIQSIWYGKQEKLFGSDFEREKLFEYSIEAMSFANSIGCNNLVFGCPRNRYLSDDADENVAIDFFEQLGMAALKYHTVFALEANPTIYNTNYINDTKSAIKLIKTINSDGFKLNLDVGTMIQNQESISELVGNIHLINHVHISEPYLKPIKNRELHIELKNLLEKEGYKGFISIEMGKVDDLGEIKKAMSYVSRIFR